MDISSVISAKLIGYKRVVLWGAGGLGTTALKKWLCNTPIAAIVDSNKSGQKTLTGRVISDPDDFDWAAPDLVIIAVSAIEEVKSKLKALRYSGNVLYIYELFIESGRSFTELEKLSIDLIATGTQPWYKLLFEKPQCIINITFRIGNAANGHKVLLPAYFILYCVHQMFCFLAGIQLPLGTKIGPGLIFAHYGTIVFTKRARIGSFFTIYHGCTVGTNDSGKGPQINNFVTQYAGAHVLGATVLNDWVRVGANSVVLDCKAETGAVLVGAPARNVRKDNHHNAGHG